MSTPQRFLALEAGPFRLAVALDSIQEILDMGGPKSPAGAGSLGPEEQPVSLARLLGAPPQEGRPATLVFHRAASPILLSACGLGSVIDVVEPPRPLPPTVACRRPGLLLGTLRDPHDGGLRLVLHVATLLALAETP